MTIRDLTHQRGCSNRIALIFFASLLAACGGGTGNNDKPSLEDTQATASTRVQVSVVKAKLLNIHRQTSVTGVVTAFRKATVAAEISGRVVSRLVEPGDKVTKGQKVLLLDAIKTKAAHAEALARVAARKVDLAASRSELARGKKLGSSASISKDDLESLTYAVQRAEAELQAGQAAAASAARSLADASVVAPFDASAEAVHVQEGDYVTPGVPVVTVADFSRLRIRAGVTADEAASLQINSSAALAFDVLGTTTLTGEIHSVGRIADPVTGTYAVEIWLDNKPNSPLREGMVADIRFPIDNSEPRLAVPVAAVFRRDGRLHVFTVEDEAANIKPVTIGRRNDTLVEVLQGIEVGDNVVVEGQFALRDGVPVTVTGSARTTKSGR